jgi:hypothetical protein
MMTDYESEYREIARQQYEEIEKLRAAVKQRDTELDVLVAWIAGDQGALETLQSVYADPRSSVANKVKAAGLAMPFEISKPASVVVQVDFREQVKAARLRTLELRKAEWARQEAQPQLDLDAPAILGHDGEGEAPDPAA